MSIPVLQDFDNYYSLNYPEEYQKYKLLKRDHYSFCGPSKDILDKYNCKYQEIDSEWHNYLKKVVERYYIDNTKNCKSKKRLDSVMKAIYLKDQNKNYGWPLAGNRNPAWYQQAEANRSIIVQKTFSHLREVSEYLKSEKKNFCGCEYCKEEEQRESLLHIQNLLYLQNVEKLSNIESEIEDLIENWPFEEEQKVSVYLTNLSKFLRYLKISNYGEIKNTLKYNEILDYLKDYINSNPKFLEDIDILSKLKRKYLYIYQEDDEMIEGILEGIFLQYFSY